MNSRTSSPARRASPRWSGSLWPTATRSSSSPTGAADSTGAARRAVPIAAAKRRSSRRAQLIKFQVPSSKIQIPILIWLLELGAWILELGAWDLPVANHASRADGGQPGHERDASHHRELPPLAA